MNSPAPAVAHANAIPLVAVLAVCAIYLAVLGPRDWIPHDDGAMAHAAERVLAGEIPHRDFNEPYTGGLTFLHAMAFEWFGVDLVSLRWMLGLFSLAFIAAIYRLALRATTHWGAAATTLLAFAWSLPNDFAPLPSWYNLFFASFGTLALFRYIEAPARRWLVLAGAMGGLSLLCKIVGLYYFAAVFLVLIDCEQRGIRPLRSTRRSTRGFRELVIAGLVVFLLALIVLVSNRLTAMSILLFVLPPVALVGLLVQRAARPRADAGSNVLSLLVNVATVSLSAAGVLLAYLSIHFATGSLDDFWAGTVSVVLRRLDYAGAPLPGVTTALASLPIVALFVLGFRSSPAPRSRLLMAAVALTGIVLVGFGGEDAVYRGVWYAVRPLIPILVIAAVVLLGRDLEGEQAARLVVLAAMTSLLGLVQFPFSGGIYFCYVAPMLIVLALHVLHAMPNPPLRLVSVFAVIAFGFAIVWLHSGATYLLGYEYQRVHANVLLDVPRGGIRVRERDASFYREIVTRIEQATDRDAAIYVAPDMPEIYFLSARRNPTRTFFDSTDADYFDPEARDDRIIAELAANDVAFGVLSRDSEFSRPVSPRVLDFLREQLPKQEIVAGHLLLWR